MRCLKVPGLWFLLLFSLSLASCPSPSGAGEGGYPWANDPEVAVGGSSATNTTYWGNISAAGPNTQNSLPTSDAGWYKDAVFYHL